MLSCFICQEEHFCTENYISHLREFHKLKDTNNCICNKCFINIPLRNYEVHIKSHNNKRKREDDENNGFLLSLDSIKVENEDYLYPENPESIEEDNSLMEVLKKIIQDDHRLLDCVFKLCKGILIEVFQII